jgi:hypothetical protein
VNNFARTAPVAVPANCRGLWSLAGSARVPVDRSRRFQPRTLWVGETAAIQIDIGQLGLLASTRLWCCALHTGE